MLQDDIKLLHDSVSDFTILLLKFARSKKQDVAEVSIKHLKSFLHQSIIIETGDATPTATKDPEHELDAVDTTVVEEPIEYKNITIHGLPENTWISILTSIITLASDSSARIQSQSTMLLFDLIEQYGSGFPPSFWNMVLSGVIKPLFDEIQYSLPSGNSARNAEKAGAFREFYEKSFERFIDIFSIYFNRLSQFNVELFNIIFNGIQNQSQIISKVAANALKYMIFKDQNLRLKGLDIVNELFTRLCSNTSLTHILNTKLTGNEEEDAQEITDLNIKKEGVIEYKEWKLYPLDCDVQCRTQLLLVEIIKDVTDKFFNEFDEQQITKLKNIVKTIWKLSRKFNEQTYLRYCLSNRGFMRDRADKTEIADLLELEKDSLSVYSHILYNLYTDKNSKDNENALQEFIDMGLEITKDFKQRNEKLLALSKTDLRKIGSIEGQPEVEEQPVAEETITDEEYKKQVSRIKKTSLEKEILSLRGALYNEFLTRQEKLDIEQIKGRLQEVTKSIIDGVICFIPKENEEYADVLKKIMTRYFDYTHDKSDE
jgi:brefeldin A-inhibited guanine nucleotide-exchange protein